MHMFDVLLLSIRAILLPKLSRQLISTHCSYPIKRNANSAITLVEVHAVELKVKWTKWPDEGDPRLPLSPPSFLETELVPSSLASRYHIFLRLIKVIGPQHLDIRLDLNLICICLPHLSSCRCLGDVIHGACPEEWQLTFQWGADAVPTWPLNPEVKSHFSPSCGCRVMPPRRAHLSPAVSQNA